jgi:hypothetical protein
MKRPERPKIAIFLPIQLTHVPNLVEWVFSELMYFPVRLGALHLQARRLLYLHVIDPIRRAPHFCGPGFLLPWPFLFLPLFTQRPRETVRKGV